MLTDTHCHLFYEQLKNDLSNVLSRANEMNVTRFICVGTNINDSKQCLSITENHENIFSSVGIHPHDSKDTEDKYIDEIYELMEYESMIAIGEMGLDYYRNISPPEIQEKVFREQLEIAQEKQTISSQKIHSTQQAKEIAEDFEAVFIGQMLQPLFKNLGAVKPFGGGSSEGMWRSMQVDEYGKAIAKAGGIGIADAVFREILKMQEIQ